MSKSIVVDENDAQRTVDTPTTRNGPVRSFTERRGTHVHVYEYVGDDAETGQRIYRLMGKEPV